MRLLGRLIKGEYIVVSPGHIDREQLTINAVKAAKTANAKFVAVISVLTSGTDSIFGRKLKVVCSDCHTC